MNNTNKQVKEVDILENITSGEWFMDGHNLESKNGWNIATLNYYAPETSHFEANARLIASAPQLAAENQKLKEVNKLLVDALLKIDAIAYRFYGWKWADDIASISQTALKEANLIK